jgi:hypothetical protein
VRRAFEDCEKQVELTKQQSLREREEYLALLEGEREAMRLRAVEERKHQDELRQRERTVNT